MNNTRMLAAMAAMIASTACGCAETDASHAGDVPGGAGGGGALGTSSSGGGETTAVTSSAGGAVTGTGGSIAGDGGGGGVDVGGQGGGGAQVACSKKVKLHMANFSWVAPLDEALGVYNNGCWGYEARGAGFRCDYSSAEADFVKTGGNGDYASYNEIKPLNVHDAAAVSNCKQQSGKPVRAYVVWNGTAWDKEGISASVVFAEVYGTQADRDSKLSIWSGETASYKSVYRPMINLSPETASDGDETYASVAKICKASSAGQWLGIYFYDPTAASGAGMADWKRKRIIEAMNDCTSE